MSGSVLKQLVIKSYSGYYAKQQYEDKLVLTRNSVSYKKEFDRPSRQDEEGEPKQLENIEWSYKTKNGFEWFGSLQMDLECLEQKEEEVLDAGGYSFDVFYEDGTKKSFHFFSTGEVKSEDLQHIFYNLRKVIPSNEETPDYMQVSQDVDYYMLDDIINTLEKGEPYTRRSLEDDFLFRLVESDFEYGKTIERIENENRQIEAFSFDEVRAFITYMKRRDRWGDKLIDDYIRDGTVLRIAKRLKKLTCEDDEDDA